MAVMAVIQEYKMDDALRKPGNDDSLHSEMD
jgi:hypothetical protein